MSLDHIKIAGFKSIRDLELELKQLNVLIGANGAGKSNFVSLFEMLNQMVERNLQLYVRQKGSADSFLYFGGKVTKQIAIELVFKPNAYRCVWVPTVTDSLIFAEETCSFSGPLNPNYEQSLGSGHEETRLYEEAQRHFDSAVPRYVLENLKEWKLFHFHDTSDSSSVKRIGDINDNFYFRPDAGNLAAFLYRLRRTEPTYYESIRDTVRMVAPFFDDFILRPTPENEDKIRLEWRERGSDYAFLAHRLSDGTLRFICLTTLLMQPKPPSTILIDEPELGLHPYAINVLGAMMRSAAQRTQLIVSTQSVSLVNQFEPEDLLVVERHDQATTMKRLSSEDLADWLEEYTLGELWEKNVLGGRPSG